MRTNKARTCFLQYAQLLPLLGPPEAILGIHTVMRINGFLSALNNNFGVPPSNSPFLVLEMNITSQPYPSTFTFSQTTLEGWDEHSEKWAGGLWATQP